MANFSKVTVINGNNLVVSVDRGVSGVGIESVSIVYNDPYYYLDFQYTNGTNELVQLPALAAGVTSFNTRIGVVTLESSDVTGALGYTPAHNGANSDITSLAGVTGGISTPDYIQFDTTPETVPTAEGSLYWDSADGNQTLSLVMAGGTATQQIGEEQFYRIKASSAITNGQVVMFTGSVGASGALTGAPAFGLTASTASYVMGIATQDIALNAWGYVTSFGLVRGLNTSLFTDGAILYLDPSVAGGLTTTIPAAPAPKVQVCAVTHAATNGSLFVRPSFGGILGQYEGDVNINGIANGDLLIRNQTSGKWVNAPLTAGTGIGVTNGAGSVTIANSGVVSLSGTANEVDVSASTGSVTISLPATINANTTGNAATASKWATARDLSFTGDATGTGSVDGSANVATALTLSNTGVTASTYKSVTVDAKGRVTAGTNPTTLAGYGITDAINTSEKGTANGVATLDSSGKVPITEIPASLIGNVSYQGTWNALTNTPTLTSSVGTKGYYYVVNVAGSTNLNGITDWKIGDWAIFDGSVWGKIDNTDSVTSVNGYTGTVVLSYSDVGAPSTTGTNATGTWGIGISGNAATATTSTNQSGGTVAATTGSFSGNVTLSGGTANGVAYLNGSKVLTTGSALTFDGANFIVGASATPSGWGGSNRLSVKQSGASAFQGLVITASANDSGVFLGHTGSVATLGASYGSTGAYAPLTFEVSGSEKMRLTSTGLGIGTSSITSGYKLELSTGGMRVSGTQANNVTGLIDSQAYYMANGSYQYLNIFQANGLGGSNVNQLYGAFFSGATAASAYTTADVHGVAIGSHTKGAGSTITNAVGISIADQTVGTNNYGLRSAVSYGSNKWNIYADGSAFNYFAGYVGIGTAVAGYTLDVNGPDNGIAINIRNISGTNRLGFGYVPTSPVDNIIQAQILAESGSGSLLLSSRTNTASSIRFYTCATTAAVERMRIDSSGNVGIGTSSPETKLTVTNNVASALPLAIKGGTASLSPLPQYTGMGFGYGSASGYLKGGILFEFTGGDGRGNLHFAVNNTSDSSNVSLSDVKMTLDKSGNLGLGVTPSASTTFPALELGAGNCVLGGSGFLDITSNAFYNGTYKYKANGAASYYEQTGGTHAWYTAPSGTAGNAISFTQAMTLNAGGNLTLGTSGTKFGWGVSGAFYNWIECAGVAGNNYMRFATGNSEAMRIDSSGNVLIGTTTAGASKLVVNSDSIQVNTAKTPASASATGTTGQIAWDSNYIYVCVATNTWKRTALATW